MILTPVPSAFSAIFKTIFAPFSKTEIALFIAFKCFSKASADLSITFTALSAVFTILSAGSI